MKNIKNINILRQHLKSLRKKGKTIGFVPTMGYLHEGHLSLVRKAREDNDIVVVSIFINPTQFSPAEDFNQYPRNLKRDLKLLKGLADIVFTPSEMSLYQKDFSTFVEVKGLSDILCGKSRKGHFIGVATVVMKLFNIVSPDTAYFGQKDAQQAAIIKKMVSDMNFDIALKVLPVVREKDGLAMSSRNVYLSEKERADAVVLFQALKSAQRLVTLKGVKDVKKIREALLDLISRKDTAKIDYIEIVDARTFEPLKTVSKDALLLMAVFIGSTRLIDNIILKPKKESVRGL